MEIPMNNNADFDVDLSLANIKVDDQNLFSDREKPSVDALNKYISSTIELKNSVQTLKTGNFFFEIKIDKLGNNVLTPSGLSISKADYWTQNIADFKFDFPKDFLDYLLQYWDEWGLEIKDNGKHAKDHIGYGIILPMNKLVDVMNLYFNIKSNERLEKIRSELFPKRN